MQSTKLTLDQNDALWRLLWDKWKVVNDQIDDYSRIAAREFYCDGRRCRYLSYELDVTPATSTWFCQHNLFSQPIGCIAGGRGYWGLPPEAVKRCSHLGSSRRYGGSTWTHLPHVGRRPLVGGVALGGILGA